MLEQKLEFMRAIAADPYDMQTRKVYADWLDEHGDDNDAEEAFLQRAWTVEKQKAIEWLIDYAKQLAVVAADGQGTSPEDITYASLVEAACVYVAEGHCKITGWGLEDFAADKVVDFWTNYRLATGNPIPDLEGADLSDHSSGLIPFSCPC